MKYENKSQILDGQLYYESGRYYFDYVYSKYYCAWGDIEDIDIYDINSDECN